MTSARQRSRGASVDPPSEYPRGTPRRGRDPPSTTARLRYPVLISLKLGESDGQLSYSLVFCSPETSFLQWSDEKRVKKYETFFGPDVDASVIKVDPENRVLAINLVTNGGVPGSTTAPETLTTRAELPDGLLSRNRA